MLQGMIIATLGLLAGCYQAHFRLFDSGLDANLVLGQYDCTMPNTDGSIRISLVRQSASPKDTIYAYELHHPTDGHHAIARLGKLQSGQHLIQIEGLSRGLIDYSFISIATPKFFTIWLPTDDAPRRAEGFGFGFKPDGQAPFIGELTGSREATVAFLESFKPSDLKVAFVCRHYDT